MPITTIWVLRLFWRIIHSSTRSKAPSCFSRRCSRLDSQRISENARVIRRWLTMMLCKPLSNLLWVAKLSMHIFKSMTWDVEHLLQCFCLGSFTLDFAWILQHTSVTLRSLMVSTVFRIVLICITIVSASVTASTEANIKICWRNLSLFVNQASKI